MKTVTVRQLLLEPVDSLIDSDVRVQGWVRTRRDSKAGMSFVAINDGSCFDNIQAVVDAKLPNYQSDVLQLSAGCSVAITGKLVESQGKGQSVEIQASAVEVFGLVEDPES